MARFTMRQPVWKRPFPNKFMEKDFYQRMIEALPDCDILLLDPHGEIRSWNLGVERIKGYTQKELIGKHFRCFYLPEDQKSGKPERLLDLAAKTGNAQDTALRVRKDGSCFWATVTISALRGRRGRVIGFIKVTRDITERRRAEQMEGLLDGAPDAIVVIDRQGAIVHVNVRSEQVFGYSRQELLGKMIEVLVPERFRAVHAGHRINFFNEPRARGMGSGMELYARRKDSSEFPVEISLSPLQTEDGIFISSAIRDITERKAEEELRRIGHELEIRNRELEQFAYLASHDLQEPLRTIANFTQMLSNQYQGHLDEEGRRATSFVLEAVERMSNLITDLLDHSRIGRSSEFEEIDCNQLVKAVLDDLSMAISQEKANVHVAFLPTIKGQRTELQLLFQNLIGNSIKFRNAEIPPEISISAIRKTDAWQFSVQDNGIGINPAYIDKIFQLFQRLHGRKQYEGTGIGLAHCKKIVKLHQGEIWVDSLPGRGSTFHFTIRDARK